MKILGISGSLTGEKTSIGVYEVLMAIKAEDPEAETELLDLKDYEVEFARGFPLSYYNDDTIAAVNKMLEADILVFGSPIYQASITGALKNLLDHLHRDAFQSKVCGIVMNGGSDKHFLVAEYQLKPVLTFLKATCAVRNVFIHNDDFNEDNEIINADIQARIRKLAQELLQLGKAFSGGNPGNLG